ncbi:MULTISPECIES: GTP-binding protein [unclassified Streptomyces]|uniref:GTP-binding protein n=1 Tax=unclassified Streptomyces TaxID=2593676 RepID=UPI0009A121E6|nr:GTP-binding protein [Streptomyces sp. TSRI0281]
MADTTTAVRSVVRGESPTAHAVEPGPIGAADLVGLRAALDASSTVTVPVAYCGARTSPSAPPGPHGRPAAPDSPSGDYMFAVADLVIINKIDLLPYVDFDGDQCEKYARSINPDLQVLKVSATTGEGMTDWYDWLGERY